MKDWHLWCSFWMPPGGAAAQLPSFLHGPRCARIPRAGKDRQQFFQKFPGHRQVGVPMVCLPQQCSSGGTRRGAPLALGSDRLPIAALGLLWDVLHPGEISWTVGRRQTAATFLLTARVGVTAVM